MKFGSLFTGVGGFDLGFERAGMECKWQVEFDKACQSVLRKHWSETELFDDVRTVGKHNLKPVDVICGGFPCQDVSIAGKRAGFDGERSSLWHEYHRILAELRPEWAVIENVPGLLSSKRGADFTAVIRGLDELGYGVAWRVFDSQYFGVAQRRRRVFIVGSLGNTSCAEILFDPESLPGDFTPGGKTGKGTASTFTIRSGGEGGGKGYLGADEMAMTLGGQPQWVMSSGQANAEIMSERRTALTGLHEQPIVFEISHASEAVRFSGSLSPTLQNRMGTGGNQVPCVWDKGQMMFGVRRFTPTECERLQGFPDGFTASQSDTQRYKQMGNAVTVNVAEWIGSRILEAF